MLYSRDFTKLTKEEQAQWKNAEAARVVATKPSGGLPSDAYMKYFDDLPLAALHFQQIFPNNYLRIGDSLRGNTEVITVKNEFKYLLDNGAGEQQVLAFIKEKEAPYIPASIFKSQNYTFGHHEAFAFREFALPPDYRADFLLVGKNSGGYEFIFVEFESPFGRITTSSGDFGEVIRKGLSQVEEWDGWIEKNYYSLRLVYDKMLGQDQILPRDFFELDKSRIHYVVVAGRRSDYTEKTYIKKRKLLKEKSILLLHYDNLLDNIALLLKHGTY